MSKLLLFKVTTVSCGVWRPLKASILKDSFHSSSEYDKIDGVLLFKKSNITFLNMWSISANQISGFYIQQVLRRQKHRWTFEIVSLSHLSPWGRIRVKIVGPISGGKNVASRRINLQSVCKIAIWRRHWSREKSSAVQRSAFLTTYCVLKTWLGALLAGCNETSQQLHILNMCSQSTNIYVFCSTREFVKKIDPFPTFSGFSWWQNH